MTKKLDDDKKGSPTQATVKPEETSGKTDDFSGKFKKYFQSLSKMAPLLLKDSITT